MIFLRSGVKRDGRLWARDARVIYNGGAYGAFKPSPPAHMSGALTQGGAYKVPHTRVESLCVYTNQVPGGYMRASGELQTVFAAETHMDMIAAELGIDPLEFRFLNALSEGDANYSGFQYRDIKCREVLERARTAWTQPKLAPLKPGNSVGRGIALLAACRTRESEAEVPARHRRQRATGGWNYRPGSQRSRDCKEVVAEVLGIKPERVTVEVPTRTTHRFTTDQRDRRDHVTGQAASRATQALIEIDESARGDSLEADPARIEWRDGRVWLRDGEKSLDLKQLASSLRGSRGGVLLITTDGSAARAYLSTVIADVEVDTESGQVQVRRLSTSMTSRWSSITLTHQGQIEEA